MVRTLINECQSRQPDLRNNRITVITQATIKNYIPNLADKHLEQSVYSWHHVA